MAQIDTFLEEIKDVDPEKQAPVLAIVGKPGIGKSKLLYEVQKNLKERGWTVLYTTATPTHSDRDRDRKVALDPGWLLKDLLRKIVETAQTTTDREWLDDAAIKEFFTGIKQ